MTEDSGSQPSDDTPLPPPDVPSGPSRDECMMGMITHALGVSISFLGPLIIWQTKGKESPFVSLHAREALNYQITLATILLACWNFAPDEWFPLMMAIYFAINTMFSVPAMIAASKGKPFKYWLPVRLID
jgi:uncharacterized Tic20 family protein